jgi:Cu/Ag efflux pump CusA
MRRKAQELQAVLARVDGVRDPRVVHQVQEPALQVGVNLPAARRHGIKPGDVRRAAAVLMAGIEVGNFFERQKVFDVVVRGVPATRHSLTSAQNLLLDTPDGDHVRLRDVADVSIRPSPADIRHEAVSRYVDVRAGVGGRDLGAVRRDVERRIAGVRFPLEYHAELLPADADAAGNAPLSLAIAAAVGIFLLLQAAFGSWRLALLAYATVPAGLVGGLVVALAGSRRLSLGELLGLFALLGLAVRAVIVLITHLQRLEREEGAVHGPELVVRGAADRLAPVLMTAVTTALALAPLVVLGNVAGNEITLPMAGVILGGLVTTTLLSVFIVPALYLHFGSPGASFAFTRPRPHELRPALRRRPDATR